MPAYVMTYNSLLEDARRYLERGNSITDPVVYEQLPRLVALAEKRLAKELKLQGYEQYYYWQMQAGVYVYEKPDLWRETKTLTIGVNLLPADTGHNTRVTLFPRTLEYLRDSYWRNPVLTGQPKFYAEYGPDNIWISPTPAEAHPSEWGIWGLPPPLNDELQSNWFTQYAPNLLLYATLLESQPFLKNDDRIQVWQSMYDRAALSYLNEDARKEQDASDKPEEGKP